MSPRWCNCDKYSWSYDLFFNDLSLASNFLILSDEILLLVIKKKNKNWIGSSGYELGFGILIGI